jgi:hypothetical protein
MQTPRHHEECSTENRKEGNVNGILARYLSIALFVIVAWAVFILILDKDRRTLVGLIRTIVGLVVLAVISGIIEWFLEKSLGHDVMTLILPIYSLAIAAGVGLTVLQIRNQNASDSRRLFMLALLLIWVICSYAALYTLEGICSDSDCTYANIKHDWQSALYFSIITFTTTGYGDYHPQSEGRLLAASEALVGYIFFGLFVSLIAALFLKREMPDSES